jgi:gamma-glutamyl:cysteine ligase YbdK (ATP-grasp superfamily)
MVVEENRWQAVRHGMSAVFAGPDGRAVPARRAVDELLNRVKLDAVSAGGAWACAHLLDLADRGGHATAMRDTLVRTDDAVGVTRHLVELGLRDLVTSLAPARELVTG